MPRLWLAIFFGYKGSTFNGMQFQLQSHVNTIEGLLVEKLYSAGFLATNHFAHLEKNEKWSRAARTDKGVHAVINGISCLFSIGKEMYLEDGTLNRNRLHLELKELFEGTEIIYHCFKRVTNRFEIRHMIKSRHYSYVCPKIMFESSILSTLPQNSVKSEGNSELSLQVNLTTQQEEEKLQKLNECCGLFIGTHNFHNYSKNLKAIDPQSHRYILDFKVRAISQQFYIFDIIGQSFVYSQIRKMIGNIIMVMTNNYAPNYITNTFFKNQIYIPLAPSEGLYLENLNFGGYNRKNEIPEALEFEGTATVDQMRSEITDLITNVNKEIWLKWLQVLKNSIHHGFECKDEDSNEIGPHDQ